MQHGESLVGRAPKINRHRQQFAQRLHNDYFCDTPTYSDAIFLLFFRITRQIIDKVVNALSAHDDFFKQKRDCTTLEGLSARQTCTEALRILTYGSGADPLDEYVRLGESTAQKTMKRFCLGVIACFGSTYLRISTKEGVSHWCKAWPTIRFCFWS